MSSHSTSKLAQRALGGSACPASPMGEGALSVERPGRGGAQRVPHHQHLVDAANHQGGGARGMPQKPSHRIQRTMPRKTQG